MKKSNRDICVEIIDTLPEEQLAHVITFLKSIKLMSDELFDEDKGKKVWEIYKDAVDLNEDNIIGDGL